MMNRVYRSLKKSSPEAFYTPRRSFQHFVAYETLISILTTCKFNTDGVSGKEAAHYGIGCFLFAKYLNRTMLANLKEFNAELSEEMKNFEISIHKVIETSNNRIEKSIETRNNLIEKNIETMKTGLITKIENLQNQMNHINSTLMYHSQRLDSLSKDLKEHMESHRIHRPQHAKNRKTRR